MPELVCRSAWLRMTLKPDVKQLYRILRYRPSSETLPCKWYYNRCRKTPRLFESELQPCFLLGVCLLVNSLGLLAIYRLLLTVGTPIVFTDESHLCYHCTVLLITLAAIKLCLLCRHIQDPSISAKIQKLIECGFISLR